MPNILIVEDDPLMSSMYEDIFKGENYEVSISPDGEAGWDMAKKLKPSLILLDIMMPKLNGIQLLEKLKLDPETARIPVIMLTNLAGDRYKDVALQKGAIKYMVKSDYTPKEVTEAVGSAIISSNQPAISVVQSDQQLSQSSDPDNDENKNQ